jgi:hypothetical protein
MLPFVAVLLGILLAYAVSGWPADGTPLVNGLVAGLAASGLYDASRGVVGAARQAADKRRNAT